MPPSLDTLTKVCADMLDKPLPGSQFRLGGGIVHKVHNILNVHHFHNFNNIHNVYIVIKLNFIILL